MDYSSRLSAPVIKRKLSGDGNSSEPTPKKFKSDKLSKIKKAKDGNVRKKMSKNAPIDLNQQCGVPLPDTGSLCARSLTCKTHSVFAKRAVQGRTAPYDTLLQEWQVKNKPEAIVPLKIISKSPEKKVKKPKKAAEIQVLGEVSDSDSASGEENDGGFDSEDECDQVFAGLKQAIHCQRPFPQIVPDESFYVVRDARISRWRNGFAGALLEEK